jgi:hypothetical protein
MPPPATDTTHGPGQQATAHPDGATGPQSERADLEALGTALSALGGKTILTTGEGRQPRLDVVNPRARSISRRIHAQADYFWWPTAEPIALRAEIPAAATLIAAALGLTHAPETSPAA